MADDHRNSKDKPRFADLIGQVKRVSNDTVDLRPPRPAPRRRPQDPDAAIPADTFGQHEALNDVAEYQHNGVQKNVVRKLRRGQFPIDDQLDLHGMDINQARAALDHFLNFARGPRTSCVRVIHGKGFSSPGFKPVLKPRVRYWLREDPRVLAYVPAPARDGGGGALYVLLRSRGLK